MYQLRTINGYDFYEVASALQKSIRRSDAKVAGYFALELWASRYVDYLWKRLFVISAEDCYGIITKEIESLFKAYCYVNEGVKEPKGRIFISKAVLLLCDCRKNRDADHLQNLVYDRKDSDVEKWIEDVTLPYEFVDGKALVWNDEIHILGGIANPYGHYKLQDGAPKLRLWAPYYQHK